MSGPCLGPGSARTAAQEPRRAGVGGRGEKRDPSARNGHSQNHAPRGNRPLAAAPQLAQTASTDLGR